MNIDKRRGRAGSLPARAKVGLLLSCSAIWIPACNGM